MYKPNLALNNQQKLMCHKIKPTNQPRKPFLVRSILTVGFIPSLETHQSLTWKNPRGVMVSELK